NDLEGKSFNFQFARNPPNAASEDLVECGDHAQFQSLRYASELCSASPSVLTQSADSASLSRRYLFQGVRSLVPELCRQLLSLGQRIRGADLHIRLYPSTLPIKLSVGARFPNFRDSHPEVVVNAINSSRVTTPSGFSNDGRSLEHFQIVGKVFGARE